ncbi:MAG: DUF4382 domain-containing protein [Burkholderiaceae bacterium]|jgi:hypothetical protein|nr:DUF4382 domain-containing protein [Burkholderiaceae bacterium]
MSRFTAAAACTAAALLACACGSGETDPGTVRFALTDAPACGFEQVSVSIERIRVNRNADANENSLGWTDLKLAPARRIDLLKLGNGVLEELGELKLPAGRYAQLRLVLAANGSGAPANSVLAGGEETALDIAAVERGGIAVAHAFSVAEDKVTDVLFDFDACRSVAPSGTTGYVLRPEVRAVPRNGATISGYVDAALAGVTVSAQKAGEPVRATVADANGRFVIAFLDPAQSPYDVVFTAAGRATAVVAAVPVSSAAGAELSRIDAPVTLPESTERSAGGTVGPAAARASARVRARQAAGSAGEVEVGRANVNATSGSYSLSLPTARARLAAYSTRLPLSFGSAGTAGLYLLDASADGYLPRLETVDLSGSSFTWNVTLVRQ